MDPHRHSKTTTGSSTSSRVKSQATTTLPNAWVDVSPHELTKQYFSRFVPRDPSSQAPT